MRLYLDANVIIYMVEGTAGLRDAILSWTERAEAEADGLLITSIVLIDPAAA